MKSFFPKKIDYTNRDIKSYYSERTNGRLVVFGDSFAETSIRKDPNETCWVFVLAKMLNFSILNYARGGSSLQYSKQMLFEYMETEYNKNDYIVFVSTSYTRIPTVPAKIDPGWAAALNNYIAGELDHRQEYKEINNFFRANNNAMEYISCYITTMKDFNNDLILISTYLDTLSNKTCIIPAFNHGNNLPNCIIDDFNLMEPSDNESMNNKKNPMKDDRICHFSTENNKILANMFYRYFETDSYHYFKMRKFVK